MGRYQVTQAQLADVLGMTASQFSKRLRGIIPLDINEIAAIAGFFNVSIGQLFGEASSPRPVGPDGGVGADDETRTRNILLGRQMVGATVLPLFEDIDDLPEAAPLRRAA